MNFKIVLKLLTLSTLSSFVLANECDKITSHFSGTDTMVNECEYDDNGFVTMVELKYGKLTQKNIKNLSGYAKLDYLTVDKMEYPKDLSFAPLKNISTFIINDYIDSFEPVFQNHAMPSNILKTLPPNVTYLEVSGFIISQSSLNELGTLTNLNQLNFFKCNFDQNLKFDVLKNIKQLSTLKINAFSKKLNGIPETLTTLTSLKNLDLGGQNISTIPNSISNLKNLEQLHLYYNKISTLPSTFRKLKNLKHLDLSNNNLTEIPDFFGNLKKLEYLEINSNKLTTVNSVIGKLTNLENLYIIDNKLTGIPSSIGNLTKLVELNIGNNAIKSLPDTIGNLAKLNILYAYDNKLTAIPNTIGNLKSLKTLSMGENRITAIPSTIGDATNLESLSLHKNKIKVIPDTIGNLKNLVELFLYENQITAIPETIDNLKKLELLYLNDNEITAFTEGLGGLKSLSQLELYNNKIDDTIPSSLNNLKDLFMVDFRENVNIKGKTLTNSNLFSCYYNDDRKNYSLCKDKNTTCLEENDKSLKTCA